MALKETREWFFDTHLGKLAVVTWGRAANPPVLLVHGYMDSAATFFPLVQKLPDNYYYVAFDLPGHGLSDPFPVGVLPCQVHLVEVVKIVVILMKWKEFIFIGHSMGPFIGTLYNAVYPNRITRMIRLEPGRFLSLLSLSQMTVWYWYTGIYGEYYDNYSRLSWDPKIKRIAPVTMPKETIIQIMRENVPPTLNVCATEDCSVEPGRQWAQDIMKEVQETTPNYLTVYAEGGHDVHITNPEAVASHVVEFLKRQFVVPVKSSL